MSPPIGVLTSYLLRWSHAVKRQANRVVEQGFGLDRDMDAQLFAVALRNFVRAAEWIARQTGNPEIRKALDAFNEVVPDTVNVRDQLEHFDAYEMGIGRLQKTRQGKLARIPSRKGIVPPVAPFNVSTASEGWNVTIQLGGFTLPIVPAARAAEALQEAIIEVLHQGNE